MDFSSILGGIGNLTGKALSGTGKGLLRGVTAVAKELDRGGQSSLINDDKVFDFEKGTPKSNAADPPSKDMSRDYTIGKSPILESKEFKSSKIDSENFFPSLQKAVDNINKNVNVVNKNVTSSHNFLYGTIKKQGEQLGKLATTVNRINDKHRRFSEEIDRLKYQISNNALKKNSNVLENYRKDYEKEDEKKDSSHGAITHTRDFLLGAAGTSLIKSVVSGILPGMLAFGIANYLRAHKQEIMKHLEEGRQETYKERYGQKEADKTKDSTPFRKMTDSWGKFFNKELPMLRKHGMDSYNPEVSKQYYENEQSQENFDERFGDWSHEGAKKPEGYYNPLSSTFWKGSGTPKNVTSSKPRMTAEKFMELTKGKRYGASMFGGFGKGGTKKGSSGSGDDRDLRRDYEILNAKVKNITTLQQLQNQSSAPPISPFLGGVGFNSRIGGYGFSGGSSSGYGGSGGDPSGLGYGGGGRGFDSSGYSSNEPVSSSRGGGTYTGGGTVGPRGGNRNQSTSSDTGGSDTPAAASGTLKEQRTDFMRQYNENPTVNGPNGQVTLKEKMMAIMMAENPDLLGRKAVLETTLNRAKAHGVTDLDKAYGVFQKGKAYYQPFWDGAFERNLAKVRGDPKLRADLEKDIKEVFEGSNYSNYGTHNSSAGVASEARRTQTITKEITGEAYSRKDRPEHASGPAGHGVAYTQQEINWHKKTLEAAETAKKSSQAQSQTQQATPQTQTQEKQYRDVTKNRQETNDEVLKRALEGIPGEYHGKAKKYLGDLTEEEKEDLVSGKTSLNDLIDKKAPFGMAGLTKQFIEKRLPDLQDNLKRREVSETSKEEVTPQGQSPQGNVQGDNVFSSNLPKGVSETPLQNKFFDKSKIPEVTATSSLGGVPEGTGKLPTKTKDANLIGVNPKLLDIVNESSKNSEYDVRIISGKNSRARSTSKHPGGNAIDIELIDRKTGRVLNNYQDSKDFREYEKFWQNARRIQMEKYPELKDSFSAGMYFSGPKGKYGALDSMHGSIGEGQAGGNWKTGLTEQQRAYFPGIQSEGMGEYSEEKWSDYLKRVGKGQGQPQWQSQSLSDWWQQPLSPGQKPIDVTPETTWQGSGIMQPGVTESLESSKVEADTKRNIEEQKAGEERLSKVPAAGSVDVESEKKLQVDRDKRLASVPAATPVTKDTVFPKSERAKDEPEPTPATPIKTTPWEKPLDKGMHSQEVRDKAFPAPAGKQGEVQIDHDRAPNLEKEKHLSDDPRPASHRGPTGEHRDHKGKDSGDKGGKHGGVQPHQRSHNPERRGAQPGHGGYGPKSDPDGIGICSV